MRTDRKARISELSLEIQRGQGREALAVKELLSLLLEDVKHNLISTTGEQTLLAQGEAQALGRILKSVTVAPPSIIAKTGDNQ